MLKIMFVCLGNICRSPMAECIMAQRVRTLGLDGKIKVGSAGTSSEEEGNPIYPPAARKLRQEGVNILPHFATKLTKEDYALYDMFVGMESSNLAAMRRIFQGDPDGKVKRLLDFTESPSDIADPWWTGDFHAAYSDICRGIDGLLAYCGEILDD